ncbi:MAG: efflux RND transporter periplasmic adaptor subunit [Acidobacteriota bacterium]
MSIRAKVYGFLLVVALLAGGWYLADRYYFDGNTTAQADSQEPAQEENPAVAVELHRAEEGSISSYLTSTSNLRPLRSVEVATQAEGIIQRVLVEEGDFVEQGQVLSILDTADLEIQQKLAEQQLSQAQLQLEQSKIQEQKAALQIENTQAELRRQEKAFAEKLVSEQEVAIYRYRIDELQYDRRMAVSEVSELNHRVQELLAEIERVKLQISHSRVLAPFSGYITQRTVEIGQTIRNLDSLFRLGAFSPLYADAHLSELAARLIHPGQKAIVSLGADGARAAKGRVARISPVVDDSTGTVKVTVELVPTDRTFKPGAFVRVQIETDARQNTILIPKRALLEEDDQNFIFVVDGDTAYRRQITLGYESESEVEVRGGLSVGEQVVVAGQGALKEGSKIRVIES